MDNPGLQADCSLSPFMRLCTFSNPSLRDIVQPQTHEILFSNAANSCRIIVIAGDQTNIVQPSSCFAYLLVCSFLFSQKVCDDDHTKQVLIPTCFPTKGHIPIHIDRVCLYFPKNIFINHDLLFSF